MGTTTSTTTTTTTTTTTRSSTSLSSTSSRVLPKRCFLFWLRFGQNTFSKQNTASHYVLRFVLKTLQNKQNKTKGNNNLQNKTKTKTHMNRASTKYYIKTKQY